MRARRTHWRFFAAIGLTLLAIGFFVAFIHSHKNVFQQLRHTPLDSVIWLFLLYAAWFGSLCLITWATVRICRGRVGGRDSLLINAYSTLVNFFVPGQGGIAVRGLYFKKYKKIAVGNYILATLLYYLSYAVVSIILLCIDSRPWWQTVLATLGMGLFCSGVIWFYIRRKKSSASALEISFRSLSPLVIATVLQSFLQVIIYAIELHDVNPSIHVSQVITYTGAANFAIFVALTPGAIGIRESFLVLTRQLHHISSSTIVAANIIDRGVFLIFLGALFILTVSYHVGSKFKMTDPRLTDETSGE